MSNSYDFTKSERWRGLFTPSLKKVLEQVHSRLTAKEDALLYVEDLCLRILAILCSKPLHSVQDIEDKVRKSFPAPIDNWALKEAKETVNSKKRKSVLPTDRVHTLLQKDVLQYKIDSSVSVFLVAVLEYISADILKLAGNYVRKIKHCEITKEDIEVAMCADKVLMDMFYQSDLKANVVPSPLPSLPAQRTSTTYEDVVKELIHDEKQYQRDLHMIIRVFREELIKIVRDQKELDPIFSNIMDIYEVTATLLGSLEDVIEISEEHSTPCVGSCFEELAEAWEFNVYTKYAQEVTSQQAKDALTTLLAKPDATSLMSAGHGFRDACKYYLPKLLLVPVWHAFVYFDYIKLLMDLSPSHDDVESFKQVQGLLTPLQCDLETILENLSKESCVPLSSRARRQLAIERTRELQNTVEHWDKDVGQNCNEFIREDSLGKLGSGKRIADRKVYLFDGLMVLCKANTKRQAPSASGATTFEYRLKEKFFMRRVEIIDRADTDELKNSFEISPRDSQTVVLAAKSVQHKNDWMADLVMVNTKSMLDRILDSILLDIEKKHPLQMPTADLYKFAIPDSPDNIVLEERESAGVPLIRGATLCKLIERLTYHIYADPMFVRTFLTTYRYFCTPQNLLSLLIERFNIPEPSLVYQDNTQNMEKDSLSCGGGVVCGDTDKMHKNSQREDWKRYRKEYVQPVQFRVLNVLRHWVDHHFYDFEKDPTLLEKLEKFLEKVNGKSMRKWVDSVLKIVQRKNEQEKSHKQITFAYGYSPPPIEQHLNVPDSEITLLTLHPIELARQLTLLEFELYKNVKPSELVGSPWTKKDKELKSPNLLKLIKHSTNVTRWIEKSIIEAENYDERVAIATRAVEVMMVMLDLNNFNGILSITFAIGSASVYRLKLTLQGMPSRHQNFLQECREMSEGRLKKYQERLRSINPPCVPFFGRYLTNIVHLEEGNPDFLPNTELINFSKRRKVSEIIGEIQQYQNQPYCLKVDPKIRSFLEHLNPFEGLSDKEISDVLYNKSVALEPRGCKQPLKFPRKWPHITLKSPGIKPRRQTNSNNNSTLTGVGAASGSGVSLIQSSLPFGSRAQNYAQAALAAGQEPCSSSGSVVGDHSPPATATTAAAAAAAVAVHNQSNNPHEFSVFANVNIPERNGSSAGNVTTTTTWHAPPQANDDAHTQNSQQQQPATNGEVPLLPRKPSTNVWGMNAFDSASTAFSPTFFVANDEQQAHSSSTNSRNNSVNEFDQAQAALHSPLPKVFLSPRHDAAAATQPQPTTNYAASANRSPFQMNTNSMTAAAAAHNRSGICHYSPTDSLASVAIGSASASPQLQTDIDFTNVAVPVSPHVNVPAPHVELRSAPPPLPPRRKERTESCADLAQKRQAPDAPLLPPRDGELSPPPIPPRLNHSTYPRNNNNNSSNNTSNSNEFIGSNNLLLPNTSSIMIRRNSAIEKRTATVATTTTTNTSVGSSNFSAGNVNNIAGCESSTIQAIPPPAPLPSSSPFTAISSPRATKMSSGASGAAANATTLFTLTSVPTLAADEQHGSISPALSSSTTTSPMTPMTPISPHIPSTGYSITTDSPDRSLLQQPLRYRPLPSHHHQSPPPPPPPAPASSSTRTTAAATTSSPSLLSSTNVGFNPFHQDNPQQQTAQRNLKLHSPQHQHQLHLHQHSHSHHQPQSQQTEHVLFVGIGSNVQQVLPQLQTSSPREFISPISADETPKLPPKPSLNESYYTNSEKGTMFLYPSTNQE